METRLLNLPIFRSILKNVNLSKTTCFTRALSTQANPAPVDAAAQLDEVVPVSKNPLDHADYFHVHNIFTVEDMFKARVHFGHKEGSLDAKMKQFLFGSRLGHCIFDLDKSADFLRQALNFTAHIAYRGGVIVFIGQSPQNCHLVEKSARECGEYAHTRAWRIGTFTNSTMMYGAVTRLPDLCIFMNTLRTVLDEHFAVTECAKMLVPTVGIVDSNCNPNLITYPVPGNDDSPSAVQFYCRVFKEAIRRGKAERERVLSKNNSV
ncbi:hypothetical protein LSTR_LSTR011421 [Laodelphax striatellus]|uniref:Small ribosomal subunit protein uS2m n=1 Tax=Laodelphax striatellus TaxID=195883 RepID=A0A482WN20_LAOST|nr:hypothetical protein LSTR_LSTR011421 [Laodelphax striatellus]